MIEEIDKLKNYIQTKYLESNEKWIKSETYSKINLKNNTIFNLVNDEKIQNTVFNYREFINEDSIQLIIDLNQFNSKIAKVNSRAKLKNSITYKIQNYFKNHEQGNIPINKCLNDLFGIRMICFTPVTHNQIYELVKSKYKNLKCIDSSKQDYKATHIYFKKDNYSFQWELQIWNYQDESNNINSHEIYKQDYIKWEKENKGGLV